MSAWDTALTQAIAGQSIDLAVLLTFFGEPMLAVPILVGAMLGLHGRHQSMRLARQLLLAGLMLLVIVQGAKRVIDRPRPAAEFLSLRSLPGGHLRHHAFPSGHSAFAAFVAGAIAFSPAALPLRVAVTTMALVVGWSRIAIGAHWFSDVLVGLLLGFGLAFMALRRHRETERWSVGETAK